MLALVTFVLIPHFSFFSSPHLKPNSWGPMVPMFYPHSIWKREGYYLLSFLLSCIFSVFFSLSLHSIDFYPSLYSLFCVCEFLLYYFSFVSFLFASPFQTRAILKGNRKTIDPPIIASLSISSHKNTSILFNITLCMDRCLNVEWCRNDMV